MESSKLLSTKGLKIVHVNIRSLYRKIDQLALLYHKVDFLLCSETWLNSKYDNNGITIEGMTLYRLDRCEASIEEKRLGNIPDRGGGVIIYAYNKWCPYICTIDDYTIITGDYECITLRVQKPNNRIMYIMCTYKPPHGSSEALLNFLRNFVNDRQVSRAEIWVLGDFNLNFLIRNNLDIMNVNRFLKEYNLAQIITSPTRLTNRGGSCIDWIITNCQYVDNVGVLNDLLSDHFPIYVIRKKARDKIKKVMKSIRNFKNYNEEHFHNLFLQIDWETFFDCEDPDTLWEVIHAKMLEILTIMCPYRNICVRENKTLWFTNEIYECIRKRAEYVYLFRKSHNNDIFEIAKFFRIKCNRLIREAKSNFIKTNLETNRNNPKKFWRTLNSILAPRNDSDTNFEFINQETKTTVPPADTSNFLNSFFANVGKRKVAVDNIFNDKIVDGDRFEIGNVTLEEVKLLFRQIDVSKDSCIEGITPTIIKSVFNTMPLAMLHMFQQSLTHGIFPLKWAVGYINLLPKGGDKRNPSNWRPITQTCIPAKILEKIVQKRLIRYLDTENILSKYQYGFRSGYSTQKAIFELLCKLHLSLNNDEIMGLLFLDISKAFDSLDHGVLLRKLSNISLAENSLNWFKSYLNRIQHVRFNGTMSDSVKFKYGIPQGSCLGPTLFLFYINDVFNEINNVNIMMFADDCVLYTSGNRWEDVHLDLQDSLNTYIAWGNEHNLSLNAKKTKAMIVCNMTRRDTLIDPAPFNAGNSTISFVRNFCYLGCIIDSELTMLPALKDVYRKVEQKVYMLGKLRYLVDKKSAILIYKQTVLPYLDYIGFILLSCNIGDRRSIQTLQNNALRLCLRYRLVDRIRVERLHREANMQSVKQRCIFQLLKLLFDYSKEPANLKIPPRPTRAGVKLVFDIPTRCSNTYLRSPLYKGSQIWNTLPDNAQRAITMTEFVKTIKQRYAVFENLLDM